MIEKIFVKQGLNKVELDKYLVKELDKAGFTKSEIVKTPLVTRIVVNVTRPGLAIGKSGSNIQQLTEMISKKFGIDNPQLEIKEITKPELDAQAVANKFKALIERGFSWRSVVFKGLGDIQRAGAQGVEIVVSGKLSGKGGRKKRVRVAAGYMKKVGEQAKLVDYGIASAYPKVGAIGVKVKIVRPETIFPDKEKIGPYIKKKEAAASAQESAKTKAVEDAKALTTEPAAPKVIALTESAPPEAASAVAAQRHVIAEQGPSKEGPPVKVHAPQIGAAFGREQAGKAAKEGIKEKETAGKHGEEKGQEKTGHKESKKGAGHDGKEGHAEATVASEASKVRAKHGPSAPPQRIEQKKNEANKSLVQSVVENGAEKKEHKKEEGRAGKADEKKHAEKVETAGHAAKKDDAGGAGK